MSWLSFFTGYIMQGELQPQYAEEIAAANAEQQRRRKARATIDQWRRMNAEARKEMRRIYREHPELEQMRVEIDRLGEDLRNRLMQGDYNATEWEALRNGNSEYTRLMQQAASGHPHGRRRTH